MNAKNKYIKKQDPNNLYNKSRKSGNMAFITNILGFNLNLNKTKVLYSSSGGT